MKLNEKILNLVCMIQGYKNFIIDQNQFCESIGRKELVKDWYEETQKLYNKIGDDALKEFGLSTNIYSFEKVLYYKITDEMKFTNFSELGKFTF